MKGVKIFGTIKSEQSKWVDEQIKKKKFYNKSHLLQQAIDALQKKEQK